MLKIEDQKRENMTRIESEIVQKRENMPRLDSEIDQTKIAVPRETLPKNGYRNFHSESDDRETQEGSGTDNTCY